MKTCRACGGVLGRDCYNEHDCLQISNSNMQHDEQAVSEIEALRAQTEQMKKDILLFRAWLEPAIEKGFMHPELKNSLKELLTSTNHYEHDNR
jgi:hypothetical protein